MNFFVHVKELAPRKYSDCGSSGSKICSCCHSIVSEALAILSIEEVKMLFSIVSDYTTVVCQFTVPSRRGGVAQESQNQVGGISKSHEEDREPNDDSEDMLKDISSIGGRLNYSKDQARRKSLTNSLDQAATSSEMCLCRGDAEELHSADHERNRRQTLSCSKLSEVLAATFSKHLKQFVGSVYGDGRRCPLHPEVRRQSPAKILEQTSSPANRNGNEVEFLDEADNVEEVHMKSPSKALNEIILSSSSPSRSPSPIVMNGMEWGNANAVDVLKEEIRREKRGSKSPAKSPAKPLENFRMR